SGKPAMIAAAPWSSAAAVAATSSAAPSTPSAREPRSPARPHSKKSAPSWAAEDARARSVRIPSGPAGWARFTGPPLPTGSTLLSRWGRRCGRLLSQGDRVRRGVSPAVGDGDQDVGDPALARDLLGDAAHHDLRLSGLAGPHLDVGPGDAPAPAGAHGLENRLFGRPPAREVLDRVLPRLAVANLPGRVNPPQEQLAVLLDHLADPRAFDDVGADPQDLHAQRPSQENAVLAEFDFISVYWGPETWPSWKPGEDSKSGFSTGLSGFRLE